MYFLRGLQCILSTDGKNKFKCTLRSHRIQQNKTIQEDSCGIKLGENRTSTGKLKMSQDKKKNEERNSWTS